MWARHAACCAHAAYHLPAFHGVTLGHELAREVQIGTREAVAVIEVDDVAAVVERADDTDDAAIGRSDRRADGPSEVRAHVARRDGAVELPSAPVAARYARVTRAMKCAIPEPRSVMRGHRYRSRALGL